MTDISNGWVGHRRLRAALAATALAASALAARPASAQTWTGGRTSPGLGEIAAIDKSGEALWIFGGEDVAGDGVEAFTQPEQAIDFRTAYAVADAQRLWARAYVADPAAAGAEVTLFVFIDTDKDPLTGGKAQAPEIDPRFTTDVSPGGYERVVGIRGDGTIGQAWTWNAQTPGFEAVAVPQGQAVAEAGQDVDPMLIGGGRHGYLQGSIALDLVGLTAACEANLYFRSVTDAAMLGDGDLEIGEAAPCKPTDGDGDGVPDLIVPTSRCTTDAECPAAGICVAGACLVAPPCVVDGDCKPEQQCSADGRCLPRPSGTCATNADCGDLVCASGVCGPCTLGGAECGSGLRCAPTGRCAGGEVSSGSGPSSGAGTAAGGGDDGLAGEEVRGGACACTALPASDRGLAWRGALLAALGAAIGLRRRHRRASGGAS